jgi:hypothetical protein
LTELATKTQEVSAKDEEIARLTTQVKELHDDEIARLTARVKELELKTNELQEEVVRCDPQGLVSRFLGSKSFATTAPMASLNLIRTAIYTELKKLKPYYPFVPEQLGYTAVSTEDFNNRTLPGYTWDEEKDQLLDPLGQPVPKFNIPLKNCKATGLVYIWPEKHMAEDVTVPPPSPPKDDVEGDDMPPAGNE